MVLLALGAVKSGFCESGMGKWSSREAGWPNRTVVQFQRSASGGLMACDPAINPSRGWLIIAQRFNAGLGAKRRQVPKGRLKTIASVVPSGLVPRASIPSVETLGYFRLSLRDKGATGLGAV
jgi:hypothetical protein